MPNAAAVPATPAVLSNDLVVGFGAVVAPLKNLWNDAAMRASFRQLIHVIHTLHSSRSVTTNASVLIPPTPPALSGYHYWTIIEDKTDHTVHIGFQNGVIFVC